MQTITSSKRTAPNNYGGNGEITAAGTYILYFRPHYDGFVNVRDATAIQRIVAEMS